MHLNRLRKFLFALVISMSCITNAQIENEIRSYVDSSEVILNNGRKLLIQSIIDKDFEKSTEVYNYLQTVAARQGYLAFTYTDILYVSLLSHNWREWIDYAKNYDEKIALPVFKDDHYISDRMYNMIKDDTEELEQAIDQSDIGQEDKDLMKIMTHIISKKELDKEYTTLLNNFKSNYQPSKYEDFVDNFAPKAVIKASWNWGMGTTVISPQGKYGDKFYTNATFYMNTDINISKVYGSLYMGGGSLMLKEPLSTTGYNFNGKDRLSYFEGGGQVGYFLARTNYLHLAPYASIGGSSLKSNIYDTEEEEREFYVVNTFTYGLGLHTQVKIFEGEANPYGMYGYAYPTHYTVKQHIALKVNVGYNFLASHIYNQSKGNIFYAQIGLVWGMGDF